MVPQFEVCSSASFVLRCRQDWPRIGGHRAKKFDILANVPQIRGCRNANRRLDLPQIEVRWYRK